MTTSRKSLLRAVALCFFGVACLSGQTVYVPTGALGQSTNGNVGIGTASPVSKLDVRLPTGVQVPALNLTTEGVASVGHGAAISFLHSNGERGFRIYERAISTNVGELRFASGSASSGYNDRMTVASTGNVGIGTTNPATRLDVVGDGSSASVINARSRQTNAYFALVTGTADDAVGELAFERTGAGSGNIYLGGNATGRIIFRSGGYAYKMLITASGDVGIGTATPTHKLSVNGTIRAKEVIVDTGWSDYVFGEDYLLASLEEVESHIREKKHLPGIPSAAEVAQGGISLGMMQAKLLAKVEELTLHMIELKKENTALRQEVEALKQVSSP